MALSLTSNTFHEKEVKVAIVDEHEEARLSLQGLVESVREFRCVGVYSHAQEAIRQAPAIGPEVVLMDVQMREISGTECLRTLKGILPKVIVVVISGLTDHETMAEAVAAGADGYLARPFLLEQCLTAVRFAIRRSRASTLPPPRRGSVPLTSSDVLQLTERESQVMSGLAKGLLYKEIAADLGISFSAVHKHQHKIFIKLHVANRTEAISKWRSDQEA